MEKLYTLDYSQTFPSPEAKRTYKALQVDVTKSFADNWWGQASYIYSKLEGNFDGLYSPFTNVGADPNISAAFDYYDFFTDGKNLNRITNDGPLSNDRRHQFKLSGYYVFPFGLSVGAAGYYRTGTPVTRYGYSDAYGRYEFFMTPRGDEGRTPDNYDLDLHLGYPLPLGPVRINFLARRLQPLQHAETGPPRPALRVPGGGQLVSDAREQGLPPARPPDAAHDRAPRRRVSF